jgi:hypothetical protein
MKMVDDDLKKKVILEPDYLLEKMDNEIVVFHPTLTSSLYLNETGGIIWELCDGQRSTGDIIELLGAVYQDNQQQIAQDVVNVITRLVENNIARLQDGEQD